MRSREIARRYADALYQIARDEDRVIAVEDELRAIAGDVSEITDMERYLTHPLVSREEKDRLLASAYGGVDEAVVGLLRLLVRNGREGYIDLILDEYLSVRSEAEQTARIRVISAQALTDEQRDALRARLEASLGRTVVLDEQLDEGLLAGVRIEVEGKVIDGTLLAKVNELRASLER